jgi:hypothetical protein
MKKAACVTVAVALAVVVAIVAMRFFVAEPVSAQTGVSEQSARTLQQKIDAIQAAEKAKNRQGTETIEVSEVELESYVLYSMRDLIPAKVDSIDVQLTPGTVAADTKLTFPSDSTGNPVLDLVIAGTHTLYVKGKLAATEGRGRFELQEVKVDGIPVPLVLIETLVDKHVKPMYPQVDLKEPFPMPWGMESLSIGTGKATIVY